MAELLALIELAKELGIITHSDELDGITVDELIDQVKAKMGKINTIFSTLTALSAMHAT